LIKDYDLEIHYHPGKAYLVTDALSRKGHTNVAMILQFPDELVKEFERLNLKVVAHAKGVTLEVQSTLLQQIRKWQLEDAGIQKIKESMKQGEAQISQRMNKAQCGLRTGCVCQRQEISERLS
jgi:hypothetical protein